MIPDTKRLPVGLYTFDYMPQVPDSSQLESGSVSLDDEFTNRPSFQLMNRAKACRSYFENVFADAITQAKVFFSVPVPATAADLPSNCSLWLIWIIVQRGQHCSDFSSCLRESWKLGELLPMSFQEIPIDTDAFFELDVTNRDHIQFLLSAACIIADSLDIAIPEGMKASCI